MNAREREGELVNAVISYCHARGGYAWRNQVGVTVLERMGVRRAIRSGRKGLPDVFAVFGPPLRVLAVECKRAGNVITPDQFRAHEELRRRGVEVVVLYDVRELAVAIGRT